MANIFSHRRKENEVRLTPSLNGTRRCVLLLFVLSLLIWNGFISTEVSPLPRSSEHSPNNQWQKLATGDSIIGGATASTSTSTSTPLRQGNGKLTVVLLSDTHGSHRDLVDVPDGDLLVHAGDFTKFGNRHDAVDFNDWLGGLPHPHKVVVAGNHDGPGSYGGRSRKKRRRPPPREERPSPSSSTSSSSAPVSLSELPSLLSNAHYLQDSGYSFPLPATAGGDRRPAVVVNVWGSPWQPQYRGFETYRSAGSDISERWEAVPNGTTILVTHTPPAGVMDGGGRGCVDLAERIAGLPALRLAAFGHFHEYGALEDGPLVYVNCAVTDGDYRVRKSPRVMTLYL